MCMLKISTKRLNMLVRERSLQQRDRERERERHKNRQTERTCQEVKILCSPLREREREGVCVCVCVLGETMCVFINFQMLSRERSANMFKT